MPGLLPLRLGLPPLQSWFRPPRAARAPLSPLPRQNLPVFPLPPRPIQPPKICARPLTRALRLLTIERPPRSPLAPPLSPAPARQPPQLPLASRVPAPAQPVLRPPLLVPRSPPLAPEQSLLVPESRLPGLWLLMLLFRPRT